MKKKLIIIGANEFQFTLVKKAKELGFETHVFAWEEGAVGKDIADFFYPISIIEKELIAREVEKIEPNGICSIATDLAVLTINFLTNKFNLVGNSIKSGKISTNKFEMRNAFKNNGIPIPYYRVVSGIGEISFSDMEFPLIVKPTDRSGSRGIYKVNTIEKLRNSIMKSISYSFEKKVLIEEFIDGKEYSVEMLSQDGNHNFLQITEKFTTGAPSFIEAGHLAPARIGEGKRNEVVEVLKKALNSLEIVNGASHSEIKVNSKGEIKVIEIGSRMGGDFIGSHMVKISTGIDFIEKVIEVAVGKKLSGLNVQPISNALVKFIFNENDKEKFEIIKEKFPSLIIESKIKGKFNEKVIDSSSRNGYYILDVKEEKKLDKILNILELNLDD